MFWKKKVNPAILPNKDDWHLIHFYEKPGIGGLMTFNKFNDEWAPTVLKETDIGYHCIIIYFSEKIQPELFHAYLIDPVFYVQRMLDQGVMGLVAKMSSAPKANEFVYGIYDNLVKSYEGDRRKKNGNVNN